MASFSLADLEKIHLALDMAQRFVRGETYHGDKPQMLLQEFNTLMKTVQQTRQQETYAMEDQHRLSSANVEDADYS